MPSSHFPLTCPKSFTVHLFLNCIPDIYNIVCSHFPVTVIIVYALLTIRLKEHENGVVFSRVKRPQQIIYSLQINFTSFTFLANVSTIIHALRSLSIVLRFFQIQSNSIIQVNFFPFIPYPPLSVFPSLANSMPNRTRRRRFSRWFLPRVYPSDL